MVVRVAQDVAPLYSGAVGSRSSSSEVSLATQHARFGVARRACAPASPWPSRLHAASVALPALVSACLGGCGANETRSARVYEEELGPAGLSEDRDSTYRISLFRYGRDVGGFIELFDIDGARNTRTNPYFSPAACAYFGAGSLTNDEFPIAAELAGASVTLTVTVGQGRLSVRDSAGDETQYTLVGEAEARSCPGSGQR